MKIVKYLFIIALLTSLLPLGMAQFPQRQEYVVTDSSRVDVAAINRSAARLAAEGVEPLLLFITAPIGDSYTEVDSYLEDAIQRYDMGSAQGMIDEGLLILVGTREMRREGDERPIYLRYGAAVAEKFDVLRRGTAKTQAAYVREDVIVPALRDSAYTQAFAGALEETRVILAGTTTSTAAVTTSEATQSAKTGGGFPRWLIFSIFGGILFFIIGAIRNHPQEKRNQAGGAKKTNAIPSQQGELQALKSKLSTLLIDISGKGELVEGHDAYLPHDPEQQTDFVLIASLAGVDRPEMVGNLRARYGRMRDQLESVEQQFTQVSSDEPASKNPAQLTLYTDRYQEMLTKTREVEQFTKELSSTWEDLHQEVEGVKQRVGSAEGELESLHERYRRMLAPKPNKTSTFSALESTLDNAKQLVDNDRPLQSLRELDAFDALAEQRSQDLKEYPLLVQRLPKRLEQLDGALASAKLRVSEGAESFNQVDDFAETSWQDIRGNGSCAEQQLADAYSWAASAKQAHRTGDFMQASDDLWDAQEALGKVDANISAIETRLRDLQQARSSALALLRENKRDYAVIEHRAKADGVEDVVREAVLKVNGQLEYAEELAEADKPDWNQVLQAAQTADRWMDKADQALDAARDKQATLQRRMQSEREEARIALDRISHYVRVHPEVNEDEVERFFEQAELSFVQAQGLEDDVERAIQLYDEAEQSAKRAYESAQVLTQRISSLQRDMQHAVAEAERKWQEASRLVQGNRAARHLKQNLEVLERSLPSADEWQHAGKQHLVRYLQQVRRIDNELNGILRQARQLNSRSGANLPTGFPRQSRPAPRVQIPVSRNSTNGSVLGGVLGGVLSDVLQDAIASDASNTRRSNANARRSHTGYADARSRYRTTTPRSPQPKRQSHARGGNLRNGNVSSGNLSSVGAKLPSRLPNITIAASPHARATTARSASNPRHSGGVSKGGWKPSDRVNVSKGGW